jgi:hypothetical protein
MGLAIPVLFLGLSFFYLNKIKKRKFILDEIFIRFIIKNKFRSSCFFKKENFLPDGKK